MFVGDLVRWLQLRWLARRLWFTPRAGAAKKRHELIRCKVSKVKQTEYVSSQTFPTAIWKLTCRMGSHGVTCLAAEVTFSPLYTPAN